MTITGTNRFVSYQAAFRYYSDYYYPNTAKTLERKLADGEALIGPPTAQPGERVLIIDGGLRYAILTEGPMRTEITVNLEQWDRLQTEHQAMREALEQLIKAQPMQDGERNGYVMGAISQAIDMARAALAAAKGDTK